MVAAQASFTGYYVTLIIFGLVGSAVFHAFRRKKDTDHHPKED